MRHAFNCDGKSPDQKRREVMIDREMNNSAMTAVMIPTSTVRQASSLLVVLICLSGTFTCIILLYLI